MNNLLPLLGTSLEQMEKESRKKLTMLKHNLIETARQKHFCGKVRERTK